MTSGERRDGSVSVSLQELRRLEDDRIDREKKSREADVIAAQRKHDAEVAMRREAEAARLRSEEEAKERIRLRDVREEAEREAMSRAAVEQARVAVEARTRAEEVERDRRHEIELARARAESQRTSGAVVVIGSGFVGFALALASAVVAYFSVVQPANARAIADLESRVGAAELRANDEAIDLTRERMRASKAESDLAASMKTIETLRGTAQTSFTCPPPPSRGGHGNVLRPKGSASNPIDSGPCVNEWDPLCGRIQNSK